MEKYGVGIEFNGLYREAKNLLEIVSKVPWLKDSHLLKSFLQDFADADERLGRSELTEAAEFVGVGGDYHDYRDLGVSFIIVHIDEGTLMGERLNLKDVYDISETDSGLTVLTTNRYAKDEFMVDAIRGDKADYALRFPDKPETPLQFIYGASRLIREWWTGSKEHDLMAEKDGKRGV